MTIIQLQYTHALVKYANYGRAAKSLGISQPALSLQIKKLEYELGFQLIDRSRKKMSVTEKGEIFLKRSKLLLNENKQLQSLVSKLRNDDTGVLKIGIIPTLAPYLIPLFIDQMNEQHDQIKMHIVELLTEEILEQIITGDLDGGIIATPITSQISFEIEPLFYEKFMLFVSPDHELSSTEFIDVKDIPVADIRLLKEGNCFRDQVNNICELAKDKSTTNLFQFESNSIESLCRIVEFKGGVTFLPELTTMHISSDREDLIKELKGSKKVRELSLINLPNQLNKENMNLLAEVIKGSLPKHLLDRGKAKPVPIS